jgi:ankyrin repeat protein
METILRLRSLFIVVTALASYTLIGMEGGKRQATEDLFTAAKKGDVQAVKAAAERGAAINALNIVYRTPLQVAVESGTLDNALFTVLIELGAFLNTEPEPLILTAVKSNNSKVVELLLHYGLERFDSGKWALKDALDNYERFEKEAPEKLQACREIIENLIRHGYQVPTERPYEHKVFPDYRAIFSRASGVPQGVKVSKGAKIPEELFLSMAKVVLFTVSEIKLSEKLQQFIDGLENEYFINVSVDSLKMALPVLAIRKFENLFERVIDALAKKKKLSNTELAQLLLPASRVGSVRIVTSILKRLDKDKTPPDILAEAFRIAAVRGNQAIVELYLERYGIDFLAPALQRILEEITLVGQLDIAYLILEKAESSIKEHPRQWRSSLTTIAQHAAIHGNLDSLNLFNLVLDSENVDLMAIARFISMRLLDPSLKELTMLPSALRNVVDKLKGSNEYRSFIAQLPQIARETLSHYLSFSGT